MNYIRSNKLLCLSLGVVLFFSTLGYSQSLKLDFDSAWQIALERSETIAAAHDEIDKADHQVKEAYSNAMPVVNATGVLQHYFVIPEVKSVMPGAFFGQEEDITLKMKQGMENTAVGTIQLDQPIYTAGKIGIAIKLAKLYGKINRHGLNVTKEELKVQLTQAFYGVILARQYLAISEDALKQAERHYQRTQRFFDQGMVSEYDLIRARVAVANLKPSITEARSAADIAKKSLKLLIGLEIEDEIEVVGSIEVPQDIAQEYDEAVAVSMESREEFNQLGLQADLYKGQHIVEKRSAYWPNLSLSVKYETMAQSDDTEFMKYQFLGGLSGSLVLAIPLFDGFASHHRAQVARINQRAALRQSKMLERSIKVEVYQARSNYNKSKEMLQAARETLQEAEKARKIAEVRYEEGIGTQLEWLDAELQYNNSKVSVLQASYDLLVARAAYDRALGQGVTENR